MKTFKIVNFDELRSFTMFYCVEGILGCYHDYSVKIMSVKK